MLHGQNRVLRGEVDDAKQQAAIDTGVKEFLQTRTRQLEDQIVEQVGEEGDRDTCTER